MESRGAVAGELPLLGENGKGRVGDERPPFLCRKDFPVWIMGGKSNKTRIMERTTPIRPALCVAIHNEQLGRQLQQQHHHQRRPRPRPHRGPISGSDHCHSRHPFTDGQSFKWEGCGAGWVDPPPSVRFPPPRDFLLQLIQLFLFKGPFLLFIHQLVAEGFFSSFFFYLEANKRVHSFSISKPWQSSGGPPFTGPSDDSVCCVWNGGNCIKSPCPHRVFFSVTSIRFLSSGTGWWAGYNIIAAISCAKIAICGSLIWRVQ